jgi:hypothetical protein
VIPVDVHAYISAPREQIYDFLADLGARVAFTDHYTGDYRLASAKPSGKGAAARYAIESPVNRQWVETTIVEAERPVRIVEATHGGRNLRSRGQIVWELTREGPTLTRVDLSILNEVGTVREGLKQRLGYRRWLGRQAKKALERLRMIFEEEPTGPLARTTVAGWEPAKGPRFGTSSRPARG